jgi:hypothetical protein
VIDWDGFVGELDHWAEAECTATFWWRDDDASAPSEALQRMISLGERHQVPLGLAVIPAAADAGLSFLRTSPEGITILQHGFAHVNHAPANEKKAEFGEHRAMTVMSEEIAAGAERLRALAAERFLAIFVPPWNRLTPALMPALPGLGFCGLSTFAPRQDRLPAAGLFQVNTHVDLIDWRGGRRPKRVSRLVGEITVHLAARRAGEVDRDEPTGVLTHHLDHGDESWDFLDELFAVTRGHPAARWLSPQQALGAG